MCSEKVDEQIEKVSIILSVYNGEKWLRQSIDSLYQQTYKNFEIICINDGSIDGTGQICLEYMKKNQNFKYVEQENHGLAYARNVGIRIASGSYVTFADADDLFAPDMISYMMKMIHTYLVPIVYTKLLPFSDAKKINPNSKVKVEVLNSKEALKKYFKEQRGNVCAGLFRRDLFQEIRFAEGMIYEDNIPKLELLLKAEKIAFSTAEKYYYRNSPESITRNNATYRNLDIVKIGYLQELIMKQSIPQFYPELRSLHEEMIAGMLYPSLLQLRKQGKIQGIQWQKYAPIAYIKRILKHGLKHGIQDRIVTFIVVMRYIQKDSVF